ncbi:YciI family protein [Brevibacterium sp. RIT 803]|uniref:YciI family protein n=1 Tax=Brevibacterium sp. RIT 803 TaxID=2810210 RepID=UPI00194F895F|nr:YciI family protein [Brevibacterium sp. RIT 803]MBM6591239.1 YciI family protein [Brevibacterium sp. RIT 803]
MKFMLIMRAVDQAAVDAFEAADFEKIIADMGAYNESMVNAGVMADGAGLSDASEGAVVDFSEDDPVVTDGPYGELRELFNGFWMVEVSSQEEAIEWAKRAPLGTGSQIEVRRVNGPEDFPQDNEWIQKEQEWITEGKLAGS